MIQIILGYYTVIVRFMHCPMTRGTLKIMEYEKHCGERYFKDKLSMPLSVTTADQLFTTAFRYHGYEKIFATLAYSRVVIDEIQSYDPEMVAVILKTLVDLSNIGCKFCIITATLPKMYLSYLLKKTRTKSLLPRFNTIPRHRIKLLANSIDDPRTINLIVTLNNKYGGVLVIVNTVKMAKRIKTILTKEYKNISAHLLHSLFIYQDRDLKENDKQTGILHNQKGIWITTQIAEVSLNIDFNSMVTEISSIDSQVQRWGRVWRNRGEDEYNHHEPNIYITSIPSDAGYIYDSDLVRITYKKLDKKDGLTLSDFDEYELVQQVFNHKSLEDSRYVSKFYTSLRILEDYDLTVDSKKEAQHLFRRISNINVIPSMSGLFKQPRGNRQGDS